MPRYRYAFLHKAFARRFFIEITRLDMSSAARFILKNIIAVPVRAFLSFSAFVVVRGTLLGVIPAPVRGKSHFSERSDTFFARPRAYKHVRALNYG